MPANQPQYSTVDEKFHAQTTGGEIVIPLVFKAGLYRAVVASEDAVIQLATLINGLSLDKVLAIYDDLGLEEAAEVSVEYFGALAKRLGAPAGK